MNSIEVDDRDVQQMVDAIFGSHFNAALSAEHRADLAYSVAMNWAMLMQFSRPYAHRLAEKVRDRVLWLKGPTGRTAAMPFQPIQEGE